MDGRKIILTNAGESAIVLFAGDESLFIVSKISIAVRAPSMHGAGEENVTGVTIEANSALSIKSRATDFPRLPKSLSWRGCKATCM